MQQQGQHVILLIDNVKSHKETDNDRNVIILTNVKIV